MIKDNSIHISTNNQELNSFGIYEQLKMRQEVFNETKSVSKVNKNVSVTWYLKEKKQKRTQIYTLNTIQI